MRKFLFVFLLLVVSTSLPLFLSWDEGLSEVNVLESEENPTDPSTLSTAETKETTLEPLTDIQDHWAKDAIESLQGKGIVSGYGDGTFGPNDLVTRAQIMKMALEAFEVETSAATDSTFLDIPTGDWAEKYIATGAAIGIVSGFEDGTFKPEQPVTRGEGLKIILEAAGFTNLTDTTGNFADVDSVRDWFAKYSAFAKKAGIVNGYNGEFQGNKGLTRGEVCVILQKVIDYLNGTE